jgi:prolyl 4-hydroxylase
MQKKYHCVLKKIIALIAFCCVCSTAEAKAPEQDKIEVLSTHPYIAIYHQFLNDEECAHLIELGKPHLQLSEVVDDESPEPYLSSARTSESMFIDADADDPILTLIEDRIAQRLSIPKENGEAMQILRYDIGQEFTPHHDYFDENEQGQNLHVKKRNNRLATLLMYLNTPEAGGETIFPLLDIKIQPVKGDALIFYNCNPNRKGNPLSLHQGAPLLQGEKWVATKWLRFERYQ